MPDAFTPEQRSSVIRAVRSTGTSAERQAIYLLKPLLSRRKLALNDASLPGTPDIVLPTLRAVIFVHGCFWHGHACRRGCRVPSTRRAYWLAKVARNRRRDIRQACALRRAGWRVF